MRNTKTAIPGIKEVPMPPAAPAPRVERELTLCLTTDQTGVRIKVGAAWAVTLYARDLRRIGPMLGMDYVKAINERNAAKADATSARSSSLEVIDNGKKTVNELEEARKTIGRLTTERDAARLDTEHWRIANERNLRDLGTAQTDLTTLQGNFDRLNDDFRAEKAARKTEATEFAAELHKRKALGWMWAGTTLVGCLAAFVASIKLGWIGGTR